MPLHIKDDATADLVTRLAKLRGLTEYQAVCFAVKADLYRAREVIPLWTHLQALHTAYLSRP